MRLAEGLSGPSEVELQRHLQPRHSVPINHTIIGGVKARAAQLCCYAVRTVYGLMGVSRLDQLHVSPDFAFTPSYFLFFRVLPYCHILQLRAPKHHP